MIRILTLLIMFSILIGCSYKRKEEQVALVILRVGLAAGAVYATEVESHSNGFYIITLDRRFHADAKLFVPIQNSQITFLPKKDATLELLQIAVCAHNNILKKNCETHFIEIEKGDK